MAEIRPFHALRFDSSKVKLADVLTQPYDKITPAMQDAYYRRESAQSGPLRTRQIRSRG